MMCVTSTPLVTLHIRPTNPPYTHTYTHIQSTLATTGNYHSSTPGKLSKVRSPPTYTYTTYYTSRHHGSVVFSCGLAVDSLHDT